MNISKHTWKYREQCNEHCRHQTSIIFIKCCHLCLSNFFELFPFSFLWLKIAFEGNLSSHVFYSSMYFFLIHFCMHLKFFFLMYHPFIVWTKIKIILWCERSQRYLQIGTWKKFAHCIYLLCHLPLDLKSECSLFLLPSFHIFIYFLCWCLGGR